ncbi:mast cell protease 4-like [Megalobrama amblycephala]|uniref:mast cell protease 4-like n=1 Tax=Megalobrama amblycephala TaxID=75352 RepID=UPI0020140FF8|nr:mast cell protease 4-like [Megalobrama amblycephala]
MTIIISLLLLASLLPHLTFTAHVNMRIMNGKEVRPLSRPYMVSLQKSGKHFCGGFLISDQFVLTAAHCWKGYDNLMVVVGAHDLRDSKSSDHISVKSYIPHPNYRPTNKPHHHDADIMLLKLKKKVKLNNKVGVIPLPKKGEDVKAACSVAGWGRLTGGSRSDLLMEAKVSIINNNECRNRWGELYSVSKMICVYGRGGTYKGDSGGPLVCGNTAVGITSFGSRHHRNTLERPNVYTKISKYIQWIKKVVGNV